MRQLNEVLLTILEIYKSYPDAFNDSEILDYQLKNKCLNPALEQICANEQDVGQSPIKTEPSLEKPLPAQDSSEDHPSESGTTECQESMTESSNPPNNAKVEVPSDVAHYSNIRLTLEHNYEEENYENVASQLIANLNLKESMHQSLQNLEKYSVSDEIIALYILIHIGTPEVVYGVFDMPQKVM